MKNLFSLMIAAIAIISFSMFYGCKKDDWKDPAQRCKILETSERTFTYDNWDNPIAVTYKVDPESTGKPTFHFRYDAQHRLIAFGGGNTHQLTYNRQGLAVIDTMIMNYAGQDARFDERLFYDSYGRIIKVVSKLYHHAADDPDNPTIGGVTTSYYRYDKRGNLIQPGVTYDNKTSVYRINPVYMLINRNYSVNNPIGPTPTTYNSAGLPAAFYGDFLEGSGAVGIVYDCKNKNGK